MLPISRYEGVNKDDPIRFYNFPIIGGIFRQRVEKCLNELSGGKRVLEIGFGSGVTFLNLNKTYKEIHGFDLTANVELITASFNKLGVRTFLKNGDILELPYQNNYFDSILLISILEHLKPEVLISVFRELHRVLKQNGQIVYGAPVDKKIMEYAFRLLGFNIKEHHFSNQEQIAVAIKSIFKEIAISNVSVWPFGKLYEIGHFIKDAG